MTEIEKTKIKIKNRIALKKEIRSYLTALLPELEKIKGKVYRAYENNQVFINGYDQTIDLLRCISQGDMSKYES